MNVHIVKAEHDHIAPIAASIREADRAELWAIACVSPEEGLRLSLDASSAAWTAFFDRSPVCMFGVSPEPVLAGVGVPWMIGAKALDRHPVTLLRYCRPYLAEMISGYVTLINWIDARNTKGIRWLKWLGFQIDSPKPSGPFGLPFHRFEMRRSFFKEQDDVETLALAPTTRRKAERSRTMDRTMKLAELMREKQPKWEELEGLVERVKVLHGELHAIHRDAVRGFPSDRTFPSNLSTGVITERIKDSLLAAIGEGYPSRSLVEMAEQDTRLAETLEQSYKQVWGV